MAIRPAKKMATEITQAKIGRSMKNFDKYMAASQASAGSPGQLLLT
jgi:hypothetical protein